MNLSALSTYVWMVLGANLAAFRSCSNRSSSARSSPIVQAVFTVSPPESPGIWHRTLTAPRELRERSPQWWVRENRIGGKDPNGGGSGAGVRCVGSPRHAR